MSLCDKMGFFITFSVITICIQTVCASIQDYNSESESNDNYQQRQRRDCYNPGIPHRGFGTPEHRFGTPEHRFGTPEHRFGPPNYRFGPPNHRFGPHGWHGPHSHNHGYGYDRPKISWNNYQDYDNINDRRTQDDYWVFPDTVDRFPPRDQFPTPLTTFTPSPTFPTRPTVLTVTTISPEVQNCIRSCPVTSEYNPVCGSNEVTYSNPSRLQCAQFCGVDVQLKRSFRCTVTTPNPVTTTKPFIPSVPTLETTTTFDFTLDERFQDKQK